ncbi:hypothetical protein BKA70DRAFT_1277286 [Coprinopsis sp. MPI-PUGE-AT-0042]|nr:hypothetical protein BKA70DRAFT_1277286 [Coprinopsis sp. MPI-PUGE-AT-0042]
MSTVHAVTLATLSLLGTEIGPSQGYIARAFRCRSSRDSDNGDRPLAVTRYFVSRWIGKMAPRNQERYHEEICQSSLGFLGCNLGGNSQEQPEDEGKSGILNRSW